MSWFSLPWSRKANARDFRKPRRRFRPAVEILEERTVPSAVDLFVVPAGTPVDNTHFGTLQAALSAGSLAGTSGSVIQIEPGSSPGNIAGLTLPSVGNLTIQGDPNVGLTEIPQFTVSDSSFIVTQNGWILEHLNIGLIQGTSGSSTTNGFLTFSANDTITGCNIVNFNSATSSVNFAGTQDTMTNSTLNESGVATLLTVNLPGPSKSTSNLISGNTFIALSSEVVPVHVLVYTGAANVADAVTGNAFIFGTAASTPSIGLLEQANISGTGLTIQDNTFTTPPTSPGIIANGIEVSAVSVSTKANILSNKFNFAPPDSSVGILVVTDNGTAAANIVGNDININDGDGLEFEVITNSDIIDAKVQGNDFHDNSGGVAVNFSGTTASLAGIDLGGGSQGSLGGNNFRDFTTSNPHAISTSSGSGTVSAQHNIFSVSNPSTVVTAGSGTTIDTSNPETGTTAFVETLYIDYLHRAGAPSELAGWVNSGLSQSQIANDIIRSQESLTDQVDALYLKILGRPADSGGQSFFVNQLQHGGTLEQVMVDMFASPEYAADTGSDGAFIQSLYNKILGRVGDNPGVAFWLGQLPSLGRAPVVGGFLNSPEFRGDAVEQLYGDPLAQAASVASLLPDLLHRTAAPSSTEVNFWVNSGLDLLSLQAAIAGTGEFFNNG